MTESMRESQARGAKALQNALDTDLAGSANAARLNRAMLHWLNEHGAQGIITTDAELRICGWSRWLEARTGQTGEALAGRNLFAAFPELVERKLDYYYQRALEGQSLVLSQKLHDFLLQLRSSHLDDAPPMSQSVRISPLVEQGTVIGTLTVIEDVTERVNRERELQRQLGERVALLNSSMAARGAAEAASGRLRQLQAITDSSLTQTSIDELMQEIVHGIRAVLKTDTAAILLAEPNGDLVLRVIDGLGGVNMVGVKVPAGTGFAGLVALERQPQSVEGDLPQSPLTSALSQFGIRALSGVPLLVEKRLLGVLYLGMCEPSAISDDDVRFLTLVGDRVALAIERVRLYDGERAARTQAEQANRLKDQFLATVSHELRTPLNAILGWARMLSTGRIDASTAKHAVEVVERNARAQAQIIDDLLDVSRISSGKLILNISPIEPVAIVAEALDAVRPAADVRGICLETRFDKEVPLIPGDPDRVQQIVWNLLSNAIKFTPRDGSVCVEVRRHSSQVAITISDTGQGISAEFLPFVFDRFRQADATITRTHSGLGLGLAIVRHLVELHGGTVEAESPGEGQGASFTVRLPLLQVIGLPQNREVDPVTKGPLVDDSVFSCPALLTGVKVLLVDDAPDSLDLMSTVLLECGAEVFTARSAEEGLVAATEQHPDVLISDIEMPGEDGYSFIRKVRSLAEKKVSEVPSVALTAHAKADDRVRALSAGFNIHVPKPVEPAELIVAISSLVQRTPASAVRDLKLAAKPQK